MSEDDHDRPIEDLTPPLGHVDDPKVQKHLDAMWRAIERQRRSYEAHAIQSRKDQHEVNELLRKRSHDLAGDIATVREEAREHHAVDEGRFEATEKLMGERDKWQGRIEGMIEKQSAESSGLRKFFIGQILVVAFMVIGWGILMERRVSTVEAKLDAGQAKAGDIEKTLDRLLERVEALGDRLPSRPPATPPTP